MFTKREKAIHSKTCAQPFAAVWSVMATKLEVHLQKKMNVYVNGGAFVLAKTDDTWRNLAEAPRNSALWLGQINFSHTHLPPKEHI